MLFSAILLVVSLYLILYVTLSVPAVQTRIKTEVEKEVSAFLGGSVRIENLVVKPFNEVVISGLRVYDPDGKRCLYVETLGAGISLWRLWSERKIEITYGEIIGLNADVSQSQEGGPLNIAFIIDAFKPKEPGNPPAKFDLKLRNVVLRRCAASFNREWQPLKNTPGTDFNHLSLSDLKADINVPRLKNDDFVIDLRRLAFKLSGGLQVEKIALRTHITPTSISVANLMVELPGSKILPADISLNFDDFGHIADALKTGSHNFVLLDNSITPSDFACFWYPLHNLHNPINLSLEAEGNIYDVKLRRLTLSEPDGLSVEAKGSLEGEGDFRKARFALSHLDVSLSGKGAEGWLEMIPASAASARSYIKPLLPFSIKGHGAGNIANGDYECELNITTAAGNVRTETQLFGVRDKKGSLNGTLSLEELNIGAILDRHDIAQVSGDIEVKGSFSGNDFSGEGNAEITEAIYKGMDLGGLTLFASKTGKELETNIEMDNQFGSATIDASALLAGADSEWRVNSDIRRLRTGAIGLLPKYSNYSLSTSIQADLKGNTPDNMTGNLEIRNFRFASPEGAALILKALSLRSSETEDEKLLELAGDWFDLELSGHYRLADIPLELQQIAAAVLPSLVPPPGKSPSAETQAEFSMLIHPDNTLTEFFNLPVRLLVPVPVSGSIDGASSIAKLDVDIPYLQQGKNKLLRDNHLVATADGADGTLNLNLATTFPAKKGDMSLSLNLWGERDDISADIGWITQENTSFKGGVSLDARLEKNHFSSVPDVEIEVNPSIFDVGSARWNIGNSRIGYKDKAVEIEGLKVWHDGQYVEIDGNVSASPLDSVRVRLADIDLGYIFDTLNINYVTFGGTATGSITGRGVFGSDPVLSTDSLFVKDLSYNGALLGDGDLRSRWINDRKEVEILADISRDGKRKAKVDGGIWIGRDSLSFGIEADRIPVDFLAPFMSAFSSEVKGYASGKAKLFGTFSDIDLTGDLYADSLTMKLDYTNTYYHGSDSVFLRSGKIEIPSFRLYDRDGHSAILTGNLEHRFFHDPKFTFRLSDARHLLCYDTNSGLNPDWYGTVYGNGGAVIRGWPGAVSVSVDMAIVGRSSFTFVLNETEAAQDYHFLTFSDHRKERLLEQQKDSLPDIPAMFRKKMEAEMGPPSNFILDLRASVSPDALFTLVMDPAAGDKITARGNGALQMEYDTKGDELQMFGKYILEEGNYNFSLQDLILRDFIIKQGSAISFNGDPMNALLDITASYRVNTNLSDLDKSFSTDRELNRTNVPVDALLMVKGDMQHPDITFDLELPTLTQDVERKVKSIISTEDMMSRQIIYLLALNRFYTPEYMGSSSNGGELASVASSTLSSQLTNMIGQLTDKFTLAPSIRSDKGDFSDVEFDVALSSRLLNNRLLINGNFGYRDRSTSTTTFVGDFDIEYLLNRSGNLRLKAYNHFNDQNYFLREALTTQGLGVIFRKDFDDAFKWLKRRKKEDMPKKSEDKDNNSGISPED